MVVSCTNRLRVASGDTIGSYLIYAGVGFCIGAATRAASCRPTPKPRRARAGLRRDRRRCLRGVRQLGVLIASALARICIAALHAAGRAAWRECRREQRHRRLPRKSGRGRLVRPTAGGGAAGRRARRRQRHPQHRHPAGFAGSRIRRSRGGWLAANQRAADGAHAALAAAHAHASRHRTARGPVAAAGHLPAGHIRLPPAPFTGRWHRRRQHQREERRGGR